MSVDLTEASIVGRLRMSRQDLSGEKEYDAGIHGVNSQFSEIGANQNNQVKAVLDNQGLRLGLAYDFLSEMEIHAGMQGRANELQTEVWNCKMVPIIRHLLHLCFFLHHLQLRHGQWCREGH